MSVFFSVHASSVTSWIRNSVMHMISYARVTYLYQSGNRNVYHSLISCLLWCTFMLGLYLATSNTLRCWTDFQFNLESCQYCIIRFYQGKHHGESKSWNNTSTNKKERVLLRVGVPSSKLYQGKMGMLISWIKETLGKCIKVQRMLNSYKKIISKLLNKNSDERR